MTIEAAIADAVREAVREEVRQAFAALLAEVERLIERAPSSADELLRVEEVARRLGLSLRTTRERIGNGEIPSVKLGRSRRVRASDVARLVATGSADNVDATIERSAAAAAERARCRMTPSANTTPGEKS